MTRKAPRGGSGPTDLASWAAALVAVVRKDEDSVGSKPAVVARRLVGFGGETVLRVVNELGTSVAVPPDTIELLMTLREWVLSPRRNPALKERLARGWTLAEMPKPGGLAVSPRASPTDLVAGAATYLSAAAMAGSLDDTQRLVTGALERLVLATSQEQVQRVIVAGMVEAGLPEPERRARRRKR